MFRRRKPTNRRLGREYVLDVKLRSSQVRAARARSITIAAGVLVGLSFGAFLLWRASHWALDQFLYENPAFATRQIDVETDGVIIKDQLINWAGVKTGDNLLALDLARVNHNLRAVPFIQSVSVTRVLPHTLQIRVAEREPLAQIVVSRSRSGGGTEQLLFNIDAQGALIPTLHPRLSEAPPPQTPEPLPLISGVPVLDVRPGQWVRLPQVQAALDLILAFNRSPLAAVMDLRKIDAGSAGVLTATTSLGSEVTFAVVDFDRQLRRWQGIEQQAQIQSKGILTLDLAVSNNIPARLQEASLVSPSPPKPPKASRPNKKHV
jgi:cell division septal protein FtsQ